MNNVLIEVFDKYTNIVVWERIYENVAVSLAVSHNHTEMNDAEVQKTIRRAAEDFNKETGFPPCKFFVRAKAVC